MNVSIHRCALVLAAFVFTLNCGDVEAQRGRRGGSDRGGGGEAGRGDSPGFGGPRGSRGGGDRSGFPGRFGRGPGGATGDGGPGDGGPTRRGLFSAGGAEGRFPTFGRFGAGGGPSRNGMAPGGIRGGERTDRGDRPAEDGATRSQRDEKPAVRVIRFGVQPKERVTVSLPQDYREYDIDFDDQISWYEWPRGREDEFYARDANADGFLTPRELAAGSRTQSNSAKQRVRVVGPASPAK